MSNFQGRQRQTGWKSILESWPMLTLLFILLCIFALGVFSFMGKMKETRENKNIAENKVLELETRKEKLLLDIGNLNTDEGKERVFRENFGLAKEGEGMIIIVDEKDESKGIVVEEKKDFFSFFKNWFR